MSSYISIGFVFEKAQNISLLFSEFLNFLTVDGEFRKISYSIDENGNDWHKKNIEGYSVDEISSLMINNFFAKTTILSRSLDAKNINFDTSITNFSHGDYGFLIEIEIEQLFKVGNRKELEHCSDIIVKFCKKIFSKLGYKYAFCDHEVNIEYDWKKFSQLDENVYSITIIPKDEDFIVKYATWEIDGLTIRS